MIYRIILPYYNTLHLFTQQHRPSLYITKSDIHSYCCTHHPVTLSYRYIRHLLLPLHPSIFHTATSVTFSCRYTGHTPVAQALFNTATPVTPSLFHTATPITLSCRYTHHPFLPLHPSPFRTATPVTISHYYMHHPFVPLHPSPFYTATCTSLPHLNTCHQHRTAPRTKKHTGV